MRGIVHGASVGASILSTYIVNVRPWNVMQNTKVRSVACIDEFNIVEIGTPRGIKKQRIVGVWQLFLLYYVLQILRQLQ